MDNELVIDKILDYCDVPQLFTARDAFDTLYICLLYDDEPMCRYTGIRISSKRLETFLTGKADLRSLFISPEKEEEYFDVSFQNGKYQKERFNMTMLSEDKLPAEGYVLSQDRRENIVVNLPIKDYGLLKELVHKFGWVCM